MHICHHSGGYSRPLFVSGCASRSGASRHDAVLRGELLAMCDLDQKVRESFGSHMSAESVAEMQAVDARHTSRMRAIVAKHGLARPLTRWR
jgi:hypothetical protein